MTEIRDEITAPPPAFGEIVIPNTGDPLDAPTPTTPYFRMYRQGAYLHRPLVFGHGIVPAPKPPRKLAEFTEPKGWFWFDGPRLSAKVVTQAISFFRRILKERDTEAEVIVTQDQATGEHRLFIPMQRVSKGGVHSLYNPEHIAPNHLVIGTMHSHCDFHAGHSATDQADASDMDGIHLTIGMLQNDPPEIAAMVAMNKIFFHYEPDMLADLTPTEDTAPLWWDRYVHDKGVTDAMRPTWASDEDWDKFMGRGKPKITVLGPNGQRSAWVPPAKPVESKPAGPYPVRTFGNPETQVEQDDLVKLAEHGWFWDVEQQNFVHLSEMRDHPGSENLLPGGPRIDDDDDDPRTNGWNADVMQDYWEDNLGKDFLDLLFATGLMTDEDMDLAIEDFPLSAETDYWEHWVKRKLGRAVGFLRARGYTATVKISPPERPLPGQTEAFPGITSGVH